MTEEQGLEHRVGYAIYRVHQAQRAAMDHALRDLGVTTPQWAVLMRLRCYADVSNAELARLNTCTPQTMNDIVRHLEATGLIEREHHPTHGTVLLTHLTAAGEQLLDGCTQRTDAVERRMLAGLSEEERHCLIEALNRCADALQADDELCSHLRVDAPIAP